MDWHGTTPAPQAHHFDRVWLPGSPGTMCHHAKPHRQRLRGSARGQKQCNRVREGDNATSESKASVTAGKSRPRPKGGADWPNVGSGRVAKMRRADRIARWWKNARKMFCTFVEEATRDSPIATHRRICGSPILGAGLQARAITRSTPTPSSRYVWVRCGLPISGLHPLATSRFNLVYYVCSCSYCGGHRPGWRSSGLDSRTTSESNLESDLVYILLRVACSLSREGGERRPCWWRLRGSCSSCSGQRSSSMRPRSRCGLFACRQKCTNVRIRIRYSYECTNTWQQKKEVKLWSNNVTLLMSMEVYEVLAEPTPGFAWEEVHKWLFPSVSLLVHHVLHAVHAPRPHHAPRPLRKLPTHFFPFYCWNWLIGTLSSSPQCGPRLLYLLPQLLAVLGSDVDIIIINIDISSVILRFWTALYQVLNTQKNTGCL